MMRQYPIGSQDPVTVSRTIAGVLEPFGFNGLTANPESQTVTVDADPIVFQVTEGSILFLLGIRKWRIQ